MCRLPLDMGGGVRSCDLVDPYAVVLLVDGTVVLLDLCEGGEGGDQVLRPSYGKQDAPFEKLSQIRRIINSLFLQTRFRIQ